MFAVLFTAQMWQETKKWPYDFPLSNDFPRAKQRGAILGRLLVHDKHMYRHNVAAKWAYVGLALPGNDGSWQDDAKVKPKTIKSALVCSIKCF